MGGMSTKISAGNVMKLPSPAIEFSAPPKKPARNRNTSSNDIVNHKPISIKQARR